jgi:hypothetical protein
MYLKVEGHKNLIRDESTKAILNTNMKEYESYINAKKIKNGEKEKIDNLEKNISSIKGDLDEIKLLLKKYINTLD